MEKNVMKWFLHRTSVETSALTFKFFPALERERRPINSFKSQIASCKLLSWKEVEGSWLISSLLSPAAK